MTFTDPVGDDLTRALKASSSMPIISKPQRTSKGLCLDGGVADSIPYDIAQQQGYKKIVIVRTRDINYHKKPASRSLTQLLHRYYPDYPLFVKAVINRPTVYNQQVDEINRLTEEKQFFTIAPQHPVKVSRIEGNTKKLVKLYETGKQETNAVLPQLLSYLEQ